MDLSKICVNARQRNPWEAIDLGVLLTRIWWSKLFLSWFIPAAVVFSVATILLGDHFWVAYVIVWWLKPLFDRAPLYIASRQLFGEDPSLSSVLRALPKIYRLDLLPWITYRRFSLTRSFDMPLTVLEQLRGSDRASRIGVLHRKYSGAAGWLTIVLIHIEMLLMMGFMSLVVIMIPENIEIDYMTLAADAGSIAMWVNHILSFLIMSIVAPFYALCGFSLYISRRVDLEAWDIEIHFRHLATKFQAKQRRLSGALVIAPFFMVVALSGGLGIAPAPVMAEPVSAETVVAESESELHDENAEPVPELVATKDAIIVILERDEFHQYETTSRWRLKEQEAVKDDEIPEWMIRVIQSFVEWLAGFDWDADPSTEGKSPVILFEMLLWGLLIGLVVFVIYRYRKAIARIVRLSDHPQQFEHDTPETLFGLDVRKDSLPSDIPLNVQRLWEAGKPREAVGLLYRGFLGTLLHDYNCKFRDSHTEGECVQVIVALERNELTDYARELTLIWQNLAYGHREPALEKVQALCVRWRELFTHV